MNKTKVKTAALPAAGLPFRFWLAAAAVILALLAIPQIGHAQGACGSASIAATLVAMEHGKIPPTINLDAADPECDLDYVPDFGRRAQIEHAICNCVGFGSKNSAVVLRKIA